MDMAEQRKPKGREEAKMVADMLQVLTAYLDKCPSMDAMDRINDACGHLRKAVLHIKKFYKIEDE